MQVIAWSDKSLKCRAGLKTTDSLTHSLTHSLAANISLPVCPATVIYICLQLLLLYFTVKYVDAIGPNHVT